jgi:chromosome segregation ATPase
MTKDDADKAKAEQEQEQQKKAQRRMQRRNAILASSIGQANVAVADLMVALEEAQEAATTAEREAVHLRLANARLKDDVARLQKQIDGPTDNLERIENTHT